MRQLDVKLEKCTSIGVSIMGMLVMMVVVLMCNISRISVDAVADDDGC
jgi:hypothetical protein